jgi:acyl-[acyl-carrier-protein]-phospholipid O-acyltransferase / long-chain-fatty-acid--[acyl-carrier-protein] ligase
MAEHSVLKSKGFRSFLVTQFLGAFNDNAFKQVVILSMVSLLSGQEETRYVALAGALFTLPFLLFSSYAGFLADRFSKKQVMVWAKVAEIVVMGLGGLAFATQNLNAILMVVFLMGLQSTFFSPAKYGLLPEVLPDEGLSRGNSVLQLFTFLAIILGTAVAGILIQCLGQRLPAMSLIFIAVAAVGTLTSLYITPVPPSGAHKPFRANAFAEVFANITEIRKNRPLFLCVLGGAYFWFVGALFLLTMPKYAEQMLNVSVSHAGFLMTSLALGIGMGSMLAGRWSGAKVEFGLVPLGAVGLGLCSVCLSFSYRSYPLTLGLVFALGINAGLYSIPLAAYIQQKSPAQAKGRILATNNFITFCGVILASPVLWLLLEGFHLNPAQIFLVVGLASFLVIVYIIWTVPDFLVRFLAWLFTHAVYRIRIVGRENIPKEGGALLVCNHVSYADGFLVQACIQRFIRFVVERAYYDLRWLNPICRLMKAIPISSTDGPRKILASLKEATDDLKKGEVVCLFAEGSITRTGNMLPFNKGLERIMRGVDVPIIPVHLDRVWGSVFSFKGGKILNRLPARLPYPVTMSFGRPLPANTPAAEIRSVVSELGADAFRFREDDQELLSTRFLRQARAHPGKACMADSTGKSMSYAQAAMASLALARAVARACPDEEMIGVILPSSVTGALLNVAVTVLGKCPINLNFTASDEAQQSALGKCRIQHIFTSRQFMEKAGLPERPCMLFLEDFRETISAQDKAAAALGFWLLPTPLLQRAFRHDRSRTVHSLATVMFSSGSTGDPKGVMLSHANINGNIEGLFQAFCFEKDECILGILPFFHSFGLTGTIWLPLTTGLKAAFHPNPLDFKGVGDLAQKERATLLAATPTFLMGYTRKCSQEQFASLRYVIVGAEKLKERIARAFSRKFGIEPLEGYGCTELSPFVATNRPDYVDAAIQQTGHKPGTIGQPLPGIAVRIVDPDTYAPGPAGEDGLLLVKGPNVMLGYLGDEDKTKEVLRDGWYATGDLASVDEDGFVTIRDRLSRFSKIGGEMVPHIRIEEEIHRLLKAGGEQMCVVTGVPDERKGEALAVLYRGALDPVEICTGLASAGLPNLWIPRKDAFHALDSIPVLGSGKLDLKQIKTLALTFRDQR